MFLINFILRGVFDMRKLGVFLVLAFVFLLLVSCAQPNNSPNKPFNPEPEFMASNVPINVVLRWEASDPDGDPLTFDVYFGTTEEPPLVEEDLTQSEYNPGTLDYNKTYYWRVVAKDDHGNEMEGDLWVFTTVGNEKPTLSYVSPNNGAQNLGLEVELEWDASDPEGEELEFDVYFGTSSSPALVVSGYGETSYNPGKLDYNTTYYWKIVARDEYGNETEGPVWNFRTKPYPDIEWSSVFGTNYEEGARGIDVMPDGDYIVVGYSNYRSGASSWYMLRLNSNGGYHWKKLKGYSGYDFARDVLALKSGGFVVAGEIGDGFVESDFVIARFDVNGDQEWFVPLGEHSLFNGAYDIERTDGGYVAVGSCYNSTNWSDFCLVKLDDDGNVQGDMRFYGGTGGETAYGVKPLDDGGYIIVGMTSSNDEDVSGNHGGTDVWVVRTFAGGGIKWAKCFGGSENDGAYDVLLTEDGGFLVVGYTESDDGNVSTNYGGRDAWVFKLDEDGNLIWEKTFGGENGDEFHAGVKTDGGFVIVGQTSSFHSDVYRRTPDKDLWVVAIDEDGNVKWQRVLGGSKDDGAWDVVEAPDGGWVIAGYSFSDDGDVGVNYGQDDFWVVKLGE